MQTLSWGGYPPIDHVLKSRNISGSGCVWVCVREWQRKSMLSCCSETEFMSRSRQFLLLLGITHKTEAYVSDFLGTQFQRVVCVCVCVYVHAHAREKGLRHMGRAHENSCGQIHQHSPFSLQNVGCPREANHFCKEVFVWIFTEMSKSEGGNTLLCKMNDASLGHGQGAQQVGGKKNDERS